MTIHLSIYSKKYITKRFEASFKICILSIFCMMCHLVSFSQSSVTISGTCINTHQQVISDATIKLYSKDSVLLYAAISDSLGNFRFEHLEKELYYLEAAHFIEGNAIIQVDLESSVDYKYILYLKENNVEEVVILYKKPVFEKKIDRFVFYVENSISSVVSNALEALAKTPGVLVSNSGISLAGKNEVEVLIDDKSIQLKGPDLLTYLQSIPADYISKIEVITNPPARYSASGNNGLINICFKKTIKKGYNGTVSGNFRQATYSAYGGSASLNYKKNRFSLISNFSINSGSLKQEISNSTSYPKQIWQVQTNNRSTKHSLFGSLNLLFETKSNAKLGLIANATYTQSKNNGETNLLFLNLENSTDSTAKSTLRIPAKMNSNNICFYLDKSLDTNGTHLYMDLTNLLYTNSAQNEITNLTDYPNFSSISNLSRFQSTSEQLTNSLTFNLVIDKMIKRFQLSYGTRLTYTSNDLNSKFYNFINSDYQLNQENSNHFVYKEGIQALFTELSKNIGKWDLKAGLRGEMIEVDARSSSFDSKIAYNYFQLFPTFYSNYQINKNHNININYGRRINRPHYTQFNPFRQFTSKYTYYQGNPAIKPSYNHNIELSYSYKFKFITTFYYSFERNGFGSIPLFTSTDNIQIYSDENFSNSFQTGFNQLFVFNQIPRLESINQLTCYYNSTKSLFSELYPTTKGFGSYIYSGNSLALDRQKTLNFFLNLLYQFPSVNGIYRSKSIASFDIGFKAKFFRNRMQLAISALDLFKTSMSSATIRMNQINTKAKTYADARQVRVSISYQFGNDQINLNKKELLNNEENNRVQ